MGVIMTGMGNDGEAGMRAIRAAGGYTLGQDERTCAVYGMPRACAEKNLLDRAVSLERIPAEISAIAGYTQFGANAAVKLSAADFSSSGGSMASRTLPISDSTEKGFERYAMSVSPNSCRPSPARCSPTLKLPSAGGRLR